jgi:branched-chain amino acid transport system substrate-binding protein
MRVRHGLVGVAIISLVLLVASCGGNSRAVKVGVLVDCTGPFSSAEQAVVAGVELPFLARGGRLRGSLPSQGITGASVAGRPVDVVVGCADTETRMLAETRRLVEVDGADVVIGPTGPTAGLVLKEYARRHPEIAFVAGPSQAPELTLSDPAPNVFRFIADGSQMMAGLGTYAYRALGWRTAAIVGSDHPYEWAEARGFAAEFCALGGRIVARLWAPAFADESGLASRVPAQADGVFVGGGIGPTATFFAKYSRLRGPLATHAVAGGAVMLDPAVLQLGRSLNGLVVAFGLPFETTATESAYVSQFRKVFPSIPTASATSILVVPFHDAAQAVADALAQVHGDLSEGEHRFMAALSQVSVRSPVGSIRLDADRQAIAPNYISRISIREGRPVIRTLAIIPAVDQTFAGEFDARSPPATRNGQACGRGMVPPWSRRLVLSPPPATR